MYVIAIGGQQVHSLAIERQSSPLEEQGGVEQAVGREQQMHGIDENLRVVAMVIFQSAEMHGSTWLGIS